MLKNSLLSRMAVYPLNETEEILTWMEQLNGRTGQEILNEYLTGHPIPTEEYRKLCDMMEEQDITVEGMVAVIKLTNICVCENEILKKSVNDRVRARLGNLFVGTEQFRRLCDLVDHPSFEEHADYVMAEQVKLNQQHYDQVKTDVGTIKLKAGEFGKLLGLSKRPGDAYFEMLTRCRQIHEKKRKYFKDIVSEARSIEKKAEFRARKPIEADGFV